jgi:hypothetical protein
MPTTYLNEIISTKEEFATDQAAGEINLNATYEDYLASIRARVERRHEAEETARRDGFELGAPELDLSEEDEAILDRVWVKLAAQKAAEQETAPLAGRAA